jgi:hypothetical protein
MAKRDTTTGRVLEQMILPALERGGYQCQEQTVIGDRLGVLGKHKIDVLATKDGKEFLISAKWQQSSGTTDEKVPYEVICLVHAVEHGSYEKAYLVLGGSGWKRKLKQFYFDAGLNDYIENADHVEILSLEEFVTKANQGRL